MFLKRLEILGFKSFANRTVVDFSAGITAVVGPNGSGKSNISDAIRWVLGEQSARSLRGAKMEDVIFAGSDSRRPVNFCEVSLTLDNSDNRLPVVFDEVTVTRRVYRSGESEYLINRKPCRLRDITELFMDTGLGRESYSIIGQGRIEEMLSTRPEDRRGPFEDAAGIVKFKYRRKEAERKLDETAANLVRIDDILAELESQSGPLQAEAEKALEYKQLADELNRFEIMLLVADIEDLKRRWETSVQTVAGLAQQRAEAQQAVEQEQAGLHAARAQLDTLTAAAQERQRQEVQAVEQRQRLEGQIEVLAERVKNLRDTVEDRRQTQEQTEAETDELIRLHEQEQQRLAQITAQLEAKSGELEAAAEAVDPDVRARLEAEIEDLNSQLFEAHQRAAHLRNEIRSAEEAQSGESRRRERLLAEQARWEQELATLDGEVEKTAAERERCLQQLEEAKNLLDVSNQAVRQAAEQEAEVVQNLHQLESKSSSLRSRLELLRDLEQGYDGYASGVRTVLQAADKGRLEGIHGAVAGLIRVDKRLELAIEVALGGALQNIVVDDEASARQAIAWLKRRQAGRATFMPLSVIQSRRMNDRDRQKVENHAGWLGIASDLIECEARYRDVVEHLLGNVVVAKDLTAANEMARALGYRFRIVTLEADVVSPGGLMSGGSHTRRGPGLLGRTRERETVETELTQLGKTIEALREQQQELRRRATEAQAKQRQAGEDLTRLRGRLAELEADLREWQARKQGVIDRLETVRLETEQLHVSETSLRQREAEARDKLRMVETELAQLEETLKARRQELERRTLEMAAAQERVTGLRVETASLSQEKRLLEQRVRELQERIQRGRRRTGELTREMERLLAAIEQAQAEARAHEQQLGDVRSALTDLEAELTSLRQAQLVAEQDVASAEKRLQSVGQRLAGVDEQLRRAEVASERADAELQHALTRLGENHHITYEWAKEHYPLEHPVAEVRRMAEGQRRQIQALGDVRLGAIEEWERLSQRLRFLQQERADLESARVQLVELIEDIDREMAERFSTTFTQIRHEFQAAFRQLFGGGQADLELTNPDDVLHSGIEVMAQPPGKKLQNLNLMSGGERALTAMALLFAILRVRPVPFCVLDEVEAALDEANVSRFARELRRFADDTQFIVITHRRGTMEEADVLYGVTMQESGVSGLISVRLEGDGEMETAG
ncbi:MAG: chromosome segregation protein SMC [Alicyclobacillus herbarius]|uniref:chromosome segregation protein SMC n=1 Tax=Alicyclobacillus herbarius TaxID=122960 RepID=UPI002356A139|nr:chromosome segregation protein SMC [Alicyclobacillus herbarius]MCL6633364.1 chromosome segregation protein SMC [Alicyclobacillus herbarius]